MALRYKFYKLFLILYAIFILKRRDVSRYTDVLIKKLVSLDAKKHRWGVSYSLFDGEELIEASIKSIRNEADYINVVYQNISWFGTESKVDLLALLQDLKNRGLIDNIIKFEPNLDKIAYKNEIQKRLIGLKDVFRAKCDFFMTLDCDEFYREKEMRKAKKDILFRGVTHSFIPIVEYGFNVTDRCLELANFSVPFYSKINRFSKIGWCKKAITLVDRTKQVSLTPFSKQYYITLISQHHMTKVRKNLVSKFQNSSAIITDDIGVTFNKKIIKVENEFNIKL